MRSGTSTQAASKSSGKISVLSSEGSNPRRIQGRSTRNSQKAALPLESSSCEKFSPPTHPNRAIDVSSQDAGRKNPSSKVKQFLDNIPTVSHLHDFPNLTVPVVFSPRRPAVKLPTSAPVSPIRKLTSGDVLNGSPITPNTSPPQVSVILPNPNTSVTREKTPPVRSSTPVILATPLSQAGGSWDHYLDKPTYQIEEQFWASRGVGKQVQLVSTDTSDVTASDLSCDSTAPVKRNSLLDQALIGVTRMTGDNSENSWSATLADLREQETEVVDMCSDCDPILITAESAPSMNAELDKINLLGLNKEKL